MKNAHQTEKWLPDMDLNHDKQIQSLLCYRYTIGQYGLKESKRFEDSVKLRIATTEKRQRAGALQKLAHIVRRRPIARFFANAYHFKNWPIRKEDLWSCASFWSAPALWRFSR